MITAEILRRSGLLKFLSDGQLRAVVRLGQTKNFVPGEEIYRHGQQAKALYVLLRGSVSLTIEEPEEFNVMSEALEEVGSVFGLAALTRSCIYSATAKCIKQATVLAVESAGLQEIVRQEPEKGLEVMAELAQFYSYRLDLARMAIRTLYRIPKSQTRKADVFDIHGESQ